MKKIFLTLLLFSIKSIQAQTTFFHTVKIEFEKTVYVRQMYRELEPRWYEQIKNQLPETALTYFNFIGDTVQSIYQPGKEAAVDPRSFYQSIADKNVVYTNYPQQKVIAQKPVFEETFLVEDSLAKIDWKITADTRTIAGFDCRKAIGTLNDSLTVFAFYTDEILINGGPESIQGLPGMILGMGIPRLHTTWFATKVEVNGVNMKPVIPATKGKKTSRAAMMQTLETLSKRWGEYGKKMIINFAI